VVLVASKRAIEPSSFSSQWIASSSVSRAISCRFDTAEVSVLEKKVECPLFLAPSISRRLEPTLKIRADVPDHWKNETIFEARKLFPLAGKPTKANIILLGQELGIETWLLDRRRRGGRCCAVFMSTKLLRFLKKQIFLERDVCVQTCKRAKTHFPGFLSETFHTSSKNLHFLHRNSGLLFSVSQIVLFTHIHTDKTRKLISIPFPHNLHQSITISH
jgi:hypothetical protein